MLSGWRQVSALKNFSAVLLDVFMVTASTLGAQWGPFTIAIFRYELGYMTPGWRLMCSVVCGFFLALPIASGVMLKQWIANRNQLDKDLKAMAAIMNPVALELSSPPPPA